MDREDLEQEQKEGSLQNQVPVDSLNSIELSPKDA